MKNRDTPLLIETMRVDSGGDIALLPFHLQRLQTSAKALGYPCDPNAVTAAIQAQLAALQHATFRLRLTLSATGCLSFEHSELAPTAEPVSLTINPAPLKQSPWLGHKTSNRSWYESAEQNLKQQPTLFDVVFFNELDELCEGSRSNLYIQQNGQWLTPPVGCGLLAGVKRAQLLASGQVNVATISRAEFLAAPKIRVSNALRGWLDATLLTDTELTQ